MPYEKYTSIYATPPDWVQAWQGNHN